MPFSEWIGFLEDIREYRCKNNKGGKTRRHEGENISANPDMWGSIHMVANVQSGKFPALLTGIPLMLTSRKCVPAVLMFSVFRMGEIQVCEV